MTLTSSISYLFIHLSIYLVIFFHAQWKKHIYEPPPLIHKYSSNIESYSLIFKMVYIRYRSMKSIQVPLNELSYAVPVVHGNHAAHLHKWNDKKIHKRYDPRKLLLESHNKVYITLFTYWFVFDWDYLLIVLVYTFILLRTVFFSHFSCIFSARTNQLSTLTFIFLFFYFIPVLFIILSSYHYDCFLMLKKFFILIRSLFFNFLSSIFIFLLFFLFFYHYCLHSNFYFYLLVSLNFLTSFDFSKDKSDSGYWGGPLYAQNATYRSD